MDAALPDAASTNRDAAVGPAPGPTVQIAWIDWARILATVAVITIHVVSLSVLAFDRVSMTTWWLAAIVYSASVWSVPLFVMVSGALLLQPGRPNDIGTVYRRRLGRILVPLIGWSLLYWAWIVFVRDIDRSPLQFAKTVLQAAPYAHLHFLFIMAGLYLITPFLRVFTDNATRRQLAVAVVLSLGLAGSYRLLALVDLTAAPTALTHFVPYVGYYLAGYFLRDTVLDGRQRRLAALVAVGAVAASVAATYVLWHTLGRGEALVPQHYLSPLSIALTIAVFLLIRSLFGGVAGGDVSAASRWRATLAGLTFGVYLVHPMFVDLLLRAVDIDASTTRAIVLFPIGIGGVFAISVVVVAILRRVPFVRRLVA